MKLLASVSFLLAFAQTYACSLLPSFQTTFDFEEYVFMAEVIDYTQPTHISGVTGLATGIRVRIKGAINLPTKNDEYVIFPFSLGSACNDGGLNEDTIQQRYPIGSYIYTAARIMNGTKNILFVSRPIYSFISRHSAFPVINKEKINLSYHDEYAYMHRQLLYIIAKQKDEDLLLQAFTSLSMMLDYQKLTLTLEDNISDQATKDFIRQELKIPDIDKASLEKLVHWKEKHKPSINDRLSKIGLARKI